MATAFTVQSIRSAFKTMYKLEDVQHIKTSEMVSQFLRDGVLTHRDVADIKANLRFD